MNDEQVTKYLEQLGFGRKKHLGLLDLEIVHLSEESPELIQGDSSPEARIRSASSALNLNNEEAIFWKEKMGKKGED